MKKLVIAGILGTSIIAVGTAGVFAAQGSNNEETTNSTASKSASSVATEDTNIQSTSIKTTEPTSSTPAEVANEKASAK